MGCSPVSFISQGTNMQDYHQSSMSHRIPLLSFLPQTPRTASEMLHFSQPLSTTNKTRVQTQLSKMEKSPNKTTEQRGFAKKKQEKLKHTDRCTKKPFHKYHKRLDTEKQEKGHWGPTRLHPYGRTFLIHNPSPILPPIQLKMGTWTCLCI